MRLQRLIFILAFVFSVIFTTTASADSKSSDVFIEASVTSSKPYVQSQVLYTLRVYYGVTIMKGNLTDPTANDAIVMRLSEIQAPPTRRDGRPYNVIERRYAILPQRSGQLTIMPSMLSGEDPLKKALQATGNKVILNVQAKPADVRGEWLPAQMLTLQESWSSQPPFRVGEPVTRTLIINAIGVSGEQLPNLEASSTVEGMNSYPAQATINTDAIHTAVTGQRIEKITLIPDKTGEVTLPAVEITWWNTQKKQPETVSLSARRIKIEQGINTQKKSVNVIAASTQQAVAQEKTTAISYWVLIAVFFITWTTMILLWKKLMPQRATWYSAKRKLKRACFRKDANKAKTVFFEWARFLWPGEKRRTLGAYIEHAQSTLLKKALQDLEAVLYATKAQPWNGERFWKACEDESRLQKEIKKQNKKKLKNKNALPPLNPG